MKFYIGTSGYMFDWWKDNVYYPENIGSKQFEFYAKEFNSVEINSTYYRFPKNKELWIKWRKQAEKLNFKGYTIKMDRYLTHMKKLNDAKEIFKGYWENGLKYLEDKLLCVLFQFPEMFRCTESNFKKLYSLQSILPKHVKFAFEFRDSSWFRKGEKENDLIKSLFLKNKNWCVVTNYTAIFEGFSKPYWAGDITGEKNVLFTTDWMYFRLHGSMGQYAGTYSAPKGADSTKPKERVKETRNELEKIADCLFIHQRYIKDTFIYFNNTDSTTDNYWVGFPLWKYFTFNPIPSAITDAREMYRLMNEKF